MSKMTKEKSVWQQLDYGLLFILLLLSICSMAAIYSATHTDTVFGQYYFLTRQAIWYGVGFVALFCVLLVNYRHLKTFSVALYFFGITLLLLVMLIGEEVKGAKSWIPLFGFNLQPSELMKLFLVIALAHFLVHEQAKHPVPTFKSDLILTLKMGIITFIPFLLILIQPDLGTALCLIAILGAMILVAGISWRVILLLVFLFASLIVGLVVLYFVNFELFSKIIEDHQLVRIYGWLDPYSSPGSYGYQLLQALMAIGSGHLMGKGFAEGVQARGYIPEVHTDFIFAVIGEEFGFIGTSILIAIYFVLIYRMVQIALSCNDTFGSYLVAGIIGLIVFQVFQNIGMTVGVMPITGLPLPFISYGGSSLITMMMAMGLVLNVHMRTKSFMFD
jgi:rod shape-determining protein RodA